MFLLLFFGCERKPGEVTTEKISSAVIKDLVKDAIDMNTIANNKLSNLIDYSIPESKNYNSVIVDSIIANNKTYYYVLLENPNPTCNRFAVYDSLLTPVLKDESLNGNLSLEKIKSGSKDFIKIDEAYLSKDTLLLNRLSLYSSNPSGFSMVFRTHTKLAKPDIEYFQDIVELSDTLIRTKISSSKKSEINNKEDYFIFIPATNVYVSNDNLFDEFIKKEVGSFNYNPVKKELTDSTKK